VQRVGNRSIPHNRLSFLSASDSRFANDAAASLIAWSQISKGKSRLAPACRSLGAEPSSAGSRSIQNSTPANSLTVKSRENNWPFRIFARFFLWAGSLRNLARCAGALTAPARDNSTKSAQKTG